MPSLEAKSILLDVWGQECRIDVGSINDSKSEFVLTAFLRDSSRIMNSAYERLREYLYLHYRRSIVPLHSGNRGFNIFHYLQPSSLRVERSKDKKRVIVLTCDNKLTGYPLEVLVVDESIVAVDSDDVIRGLAVTY